MRMLLLGLSLVVFACWSHAASDASERITLRLKQSGVDLRDEAALIRTLRTTDNPRLATAAAYALGQLPKSEAIIRELNFTVLADDELLMNYAIRALLNFGDRQWVPAALARLPNVQHRGVQLHLAAELAAAGWYEGWDLTEAVIVTGDIWLGTALFEVGNFRGMKDATGKPVDLLAKLDELRLRAPESARSAIAQAIVRIGSEDIPELRRKFPGSPE